MEILYNGVNRLNYPKIEIWSMSNSVQRPPIVSQTRLFTSQTVEIQVPCADHPIESYLEQPDRLLRTLAPGDRMDLMENGCWVTFNAVLIRIFKTAAKILVKSVNRKKVRTKNSNTEKCAILIFSGAFLLTVCPSERIDRTQNQNY